MAKIRSLKYVIQEIEKVEASLRKHAKGPAAPKAKQKLNRLARLKQTADDICEKDPETGDIFSPIPDSTLAKYAARAKKGKKKTGRK